MATLQGDLQRLVTAPVGRLLWSYSIPAVTGMLVMSLYNVVDRVFIGQVVGPDAIAGLAITFPVMNLSTAMGVLIGVGASARASICLGRGDKPLAETILGNSLTLILGICLVYLSIFGIFLDPILRAFGASEATLPYARDFMSWILPGMLVMNLTFSFNNIMRATGYPVKAMWTMILGAGINIVLVPVFIWWLGMGIKGAALATDIAMTIGGIFVFRHFFRRDVTVGFKRGTFRPQLRVAWQIVNIGAAPSLVNAAACLINVIINRSLYEHGGDSAIAAAGIFVTYTSILVTICIGICQGMQPIMGYNYGAGRIDRLQRTYWLAAVTATVICSIGCLGGLFLPGTIALAFTRDAQLIHATEIALSTAMLAFAVVGFQIISTNFFQSIGRAGKSIFLSLTRQVIFLIPMLLLLPHHFGLKGVWASFAVSDVLATMVTLLMVIWQFRHIRRTQVVKPVTG